MERKTAGSEPGAADPTAGAASGDAVMVADERAFAERMLRAEAAAVEGLIGRLGPSFHEAVRLIVHGADSGGTVLVTGLGKSGLIGAKISATMASLAIPSHFVHPSEAAHGDLGRFRASDICVALSYSGETDEVVALAGILRQDGVPVISITSGTGGSGRGESGREGSSLEGLASASLTIGDVDRGAAEAPPLPPAPACSTTAMSALGDVLALAACRRRNFTDDDFHKRHPGGSLGGQLRPVMDVLRFEVGKNLEAVPDDRSVGEALALGDGAVRRPGAVLLVSPETGRLTGIFTDGDLRRLIVRDRRELDRPIRELMTRSPATLARTALVRDAVNLIREKRRDEIPVVDEDGRPVGILDVQDLIAMRLVRE